jgi:tetratricopeptide (TPR) repeat protein
VRPADTRLLWLPALLAVTALAGLNGLAGPLQFDDHLLAVDRATQDWSAWWDTLGRMVRPLLKASYIVSHRLGERLGDVPLGHHLVNLVIHLLVVLLAYRVARRLGQTVWRDVPGAGGRAAAAGSAAVLALHPLATEAVTYLSGRSVALATAWALAALLMHMAGARSATASARLLWRGGAVLCCVAAVLTREAMFVVPAALLLWEWARGDQRTVPFTAQSLLAALRRTLGYWLLALGAVIGLLLNDGYANLVGMSRLIAQGRIAEPTLLPALEYFAARLLLLAPLSIDPELRTHDLGLLHRLALGAALIALLAYAWRVRQRRPHWLFGLAWILLFLAPLYLVPLRHDPVAERHFYPALFGVGLILATEAARLAARGAMAARGIAIAATLAIVVLVGATVVRNAAYVSEVDLWKATARASPGKARVFHNLGVAYMKEARWDRAVASFDRALELEPGYRLAQEHRERAAIKLRTGDPAAEPEI